MPKRRKVRRTHERKGKKFAAKKKQPSSRELLLLLKKEHRNLLKLSDKIPDSKLRSEVREILVAAEENADHERFHGFDWETTYDLTIENHLEDESEAVREWFEKNHPNFRKCP